MPPSNSIYDSPTERESLALREDGIEYGIVRHTIGSGKTLTSFKASTLLKENDSIHKCVFVVDRKDLDRQTLEEFNPFQEGGVEENTNTADLVRSLLSEDYSNRGIVPPQSEISIRPRRNNAAFIALSK